MESNDLIGRRFRRIEPKDDVFDLVEINGAQGDTLIVSPMAFGSNYEVDASTFIAAYTSQGVVQRPDVEARTSPEAKDAYETQLAEQRAADREAALSQIDISKYKDFIND